MRTLTVTRTTPAAIDDVFDAYTDHEQLSKVACVRSCRSAPERDTEKHGLGAIREVDCDAI